MDRERSSNRERIERYQQHIRQAAADAGAVEFFYRSRASRPAARYGANDNDRLRRDNAEQRLLTSFVNEVIDRIAAETPRRSSLTQE
jgi:hypothetical protein